MIDAIKKLGKASARYAKFKFDQKMVPLVCEEVDSLKDFGLTQDESDKVLLEIASMWKFKRNGRAVKFMTHFFYGKGEPLEFEMYDLLNEDAGVRKRVAKALAERLVNPLWAEHQFAGGICTRLKPRPEFYPGQGAPEYASPDEFPIRQSDYENEDWHLATGTLPAEWEATGMASVPENSAGPMCGHKVGQEWVDTGTMALVRTPLKPPQGKQSTDSMPKYALIWGVREWHWHDTDLDGTKKRITDCIHKAGYRMNESGAAKNFWVFGKPCIVEVKTGNPVKVG